MRNLMPILENALCSVEPVAVISVGEPQQSLLHNVSQIASESLLHFVTYELASVTVFRYGSMYLIKIIMIPLPGI